MSKWHYREGDLMQPWFKQHHEIHLPSFKQCSTQKASNGAWELNSLYRVPRRLLWRGQHCWEGKCHCGYTEINSVQKLSNHTTYFRKYVHLGIYTGCPRRNVKYFRRVFLMLNYTDITQNTYIQSWTVTEIMAREVWNFDSCYTLIDYQIHIETGRDMWFM